MNIIKCGKKYRRIVKRLGNKPKFAMGEMVFSPASPTLKREIIRLHISPDPTIEHQYRVRIFDHNAMPCKSAWISESHLEAYNHQKSNVA